MHMQEKHKTKAHVTIPKYTACGKLVKINERKCGGDAWSFQITDVNLRLYPRMAWRVQPDMHKPDQAEEP